MNPTISNLLDELNNFQSNQPLPIEDIVSLYSAATQKNEIVSAVLIEAYIRKLEAGNAVSPASFLGSDSRSSLCRRLQNVADLHSVVKASELDSMWADRCPKVGDSIGSYLLLEHLGRGAFSNVYLAADTNTGHRRVVVKLSPNGNEEACLLGTLNHPSLPKVLSFSFDKDCDLAVMCMEFVGRKTLIDVIDESHSSPSIPEKSVSQKVEWIEQVAEGLAHAHKKGVLHLDIKPGNVLISDQDKAVLIDFNLGLPITKAQAIGFRGTVAYAAPELLQATITGSISEDPVGAEADVFSLGVVFYELLTGKLPWDSIEQQKEVDLLAHRLSLNDNHILAPSKSKKVIPRKLDHIVLKAMALDPKDRYESVASFLQAIRKSRLASGRTRTFLGFFLASCALLMTGYFVIEYSVGRYHDEAPRARPFNGFHSQTTSLGRQDGAHYVRVPLDETLRQQRETNNQQSDQSQKVAEPTTSTSDRVIADAYELLLQQHWDQSIDTLRTVTQVQSGQMATLLLAYAYFRNHQIAVSRRLLDDILKDSPENARALLIRSLVELEFSNIDDAPPNCEFIDRLLKVVKFTEDNSFVEIAIEYESHFCKSDVYRQRIADSAIQADSRSNLQSLVRNAPSRNHVGSLSTDCDETILALLLRKY